MPWRGFTAESKAFLGYDALPLAGRLRFWCGFGPAAVRFFYYGVRDAIVLRVVRERA